MAVELAEYGINVNNSAPGAIESEMAKFARAVAAGSPAGLYRMSGHLAVQWALRNHVFDALGLPRLYVAR